MKNIYELSTQDKDKYRGEFNNLKFTKDINALKGPSLFVAIAALIGSGILSSLVEEGLKFQTWVNYTDTIGIIALILFSVMEIYLKVSFMRWMKIKHNIEY